MVILGVGVTSPSGNAQAESEYEENKSRRHGGETMRAPKSQTKAQASGHTSDAPAPTSLAQPPPLRSVIPFLPRALCSPAPQGISKENSFLQ